MFEPTEIEMPNSAGKAGALDLGSRAESEMAYKVPEAPSWRKIGYLVLYSIGCALVVMAMLCAVNFAWNLSEHPRIIGWQFDAIFVIVVVYMTGLVTGLRFR